MLEQDYSKDTEFVYLTGEGQTSEGSRPFKVTNRRLTVGGETYSMSSINSVKSEWIRKTSWGWFFIPVKSTVLLVLLGYIIYSAVFHFSIFFNGEWPEHVFGYVFRLMIQLLVFFIIADIDDRSEAQYMYRITIIDSFGKSHTILYFDFLPWELLPKTNNQPERLNHPEDYFEVQWSSAGTNPKYAAIREKVNYVKRVNEAISTAIAHRK